MQLAWRGRMGEVLGCDTNGDAVARLQVVTKFAQGPAAARHQHQTIAVAGEQVRQFQSDATGGASDQSRLGGVEGIACTHDSVIADFGVSQQCLLRLRLRANLRLQESHDLPALLFRQARPRRHACVQIAIGDKPEQLAGRGFLGRRVVKRRRRSYALQIGAVALRTVLPKELLATGRGLGIVSVGVLHLRGRRRRVMKTGFLSYRRDYPKYCTDGKKESRVENDAGAWCQKFPPSELFYREITGTIV